MRLVLCDDHRLLVEAIEVVLTGLGHEVCAITTTPEEAIAAVRTHQPDILLLDVAFPGSRSIETIPRVAEAGPDTRVVLLSAEASPAVVAQAIASGASGFVRKERMMSDLVDALELARQGHLAVEPNLLQRALRAGSSNEDPLWPLSFLTDREWQVLRCIVDGNGTDDIAERLKVQRSTARTHVQSVLSKLGVHSRLQAAALVAAHGSDDMWPAHVR